MSVDFYLFQIGWIIILFVCLFWFFKGVFSCFLFCYLILWEGGGGVRKVKASLNTLTLLIPVFEP